MPNMTLGNYGIPGPVGADEFNEESDEVKRRRLQLQALLGPQKGATGLGGGIANFIAAASQGYFDNQLRDQEKDIGARRSAAAQAWLARMPSDRPGTPEQVGSGPLAPPPGTPGVEPSGGGSDPMNTPEPGPDAPASAFSATPPESGAAWVNPKGMSMIPNGVDFVPNKAATPMIPTNLQDTAKWALEGAGFSPLHAAIAQHSYTTALDAPVRAEAARLAREGRADEAQKRRDEFAHQKELTNIEWDRRQATTDADITNRNTLAALDRGVQQEANIRLAASLRPNNTIEAQGDFSKTGEAYLATLPPEDAAVVKKIASGEIPLTSFSTRGGHREVLAKEVAAADPTYNATRPGMWNEFTKGPTAKNITAINTAIAHMGTMADLAGALQSGQTNAVNSIVNAVKTQLGNPAVTDYETARQAVGEELMRTFRVAGASEREAQAWMDRFKTQGSPEQVQGALATATKLLVGRIDAVDDQWKRGTQSKTGFPALVSPENEALMARFGVKRKGSDAPAAPPVAGPRVPGQEATPKVLNKEATTIPGVKRARGADGKWWIKLPGQAPVLDPDQNG